MQTSRNELYFSYFSIELVKKMNLASNIRIALIIFFYFSLFSNLPAPDFIEYKVQEGDTLSKISKEKLNDPNRWREFLKYNKIDTPNLIRPGLVLKIPIYLAKETPIRPPYAEVSIFHGEVHIKSTAEEDWRDVESNQKLYQKDILRTKKKSGAEIFFVNDPTSIIHIRENSFIKIEETNNKKTIFLSFGEIVGLVTRDKNSNEPKLNVVTPAAVASVRGTIFDVDVNEQATSKFSTRKGLISVAAQGVSVDVPEGYATIVIKGQPPEKPFKLLGKVNTKNNNEINE